jgi:hypothetical protein
LTVKSGTLYDLNRDSFTLSIQGELTLSNAKGSVTLALAGEGNGSGDDYLVVCSVVNATGDFAGSQAPAFAEVQFAGGPNGTFNLAFVERPVPTLSADSIGGTYYIPPVIHDDFLSLFGPWSTDYELSGLAIVGPCGPAYVTGDLMVESKLSFPTRFGLGNILSSVGGELTLTNAKGSVTLDFGSASYGSLAGYPVVCSVVNATGEYAGWQVPAFAEIQLVGGSRDGDSGTFNLTFIDKPIVASPTFTSGPTASFTKGTTGPVYVAAASEPGGEAVTYSLASNLNNALAINPISGAVTVAQPDLLQPGTYTFAVQATDGINRTSQTVTLTVVNPALGSISGAYDIPVLAHSALAGYWCTTYDLAGHGNFGPLGPADVSGILLLQTDLYPRYEFGPGIQNAIPLPMTTVTGELTLSNANGSVTLAIGGSDLSEMTFSISRATGDYASWTASGLIEGQFTGGSSDGSSGTFSLTFTESKPIPASPLFTGGTPASPSFTSGTAATYTKGTNGPIYTAAASDPAGGTLTYRLISSPGNALAIDATSGAVTVVQPDPLHPGTYTFTVEAGDGNNTADQTVTLTVFDAPKPHPLAGKIIGTVHVSKATGAKAVTVSLTGTGALGVLGTVELSGMLTGRPHGDAGDAVSGRVTLKNALGEVTLQLTGPSDSDSPLMPDVFRYSVIKSGGAYTRLRSTGIIHLHASASSGDFTLTINPDILA